MTDPTPPRKRRLWPLFIAPGLLLIGALVWSGFWFYAAGQVDQTIEGWRAREAQSGRIHSCNNRSVAGFPFRLEVNCDNASVALVSQTAEQVEKQIPSILRFTKILVVGQIYTPNLLIAEFTAPATLSEASRPPILIANWRTARASVAGSPQSPQQVSLIVQDANLDRMEGATHVPLLRADRIALHGRPTPGSAPGQPVIEVALQFDGAQGPDIHPALAKAFNAQVMAQLHGLKDFTPKPWPERFRELQAMDGRIEIKQSRLQQGDLISTATGALSIAPDGHLKGQLDLTVAGIDQVLAAMGLDKLLGPLNNLIPGGALGMLGKPATLDGKKAVLVPLVFANGTVRLGPLQVAQTAPLF